jgi:hypothetical protein
MADDLKNLLAAWRATELAESLEALNYTTPVAVAEDLLVGDFNDDTVVTGVLNKLKSAAVGSIPTDATAAKAIVKRAMDSAQAALPKLREHAVAAALSPPTPKEDPRKGKNKRERKESRKETMRTATEYIVHQRRDQALARYAAPIASVVGQIRTTLTESRTTGRPALPAWRRLHFGYRRSATNKDKKSKTSRKERKGGDRDSSDSSESDAEDTEIGARPMGLFYQATRSLAFAGAVEAPPDVTPAPCDVLKGLEKEDPTTKAKTSFTFEATNVSCDDLFGEYVRVCEEQGLYKDQRPLAEATWEAVSHAITRNGSVTQAIEKVLMDGLPTDRVDRFREASTPSKPAAGTPPQKATKPPNAVWKSDALCPEFYGPTGYCANMKECGYKHNFEARLKLAEKVLEKSRGGGGGGDRRSDRDRESDRDIDRDRDRDRRDRDNQPLRGGARR